MRRIIYVREIITILKEPRICPVCEKDDKLETNTISENISSDKTILCTRCEALTIVTSLNLKRIELSGIHDDMILLKEPYNIRRVSY